jgi:hypothetical protein
VRGKSIRQRRTWRRGSPRGGDGGGSWLGRSVDGDTSIGRFGHKAREAAEGGRASLQAGGIGRGEKISAW